MPAYFCNNFVYCQPILIILAHIHYRKFATRGRYTVDPPNMVCVTALPCKILTTTFFMLNFIHIYCTPWSAGQGDLVVPCMDITAGFSPRKLSVAGPCGGDPVGVWVSWGPAPSLSGSGGPNVHSTMLLYMACNP